ncbi:MULTISPECIES: hypothetical protein [unclassified Streptomyces]|uniref:DinB/UmuC family translesion DNA polymerase n=1 Tax=unclassified Streptomyces TaxID=2593676 RepID=UPI0018FE643B|nr:MULTISPECIES: hypothetical protein [unclassified Streptomyces]
MPTEPPARSSTPTPTSSPPAPAPPTSTASATRAPEAPADRSTSTRSRTLAEATARTRPIATTAYELYDLVALQRARVRTISLRAYDLRPASEATQQLTLDPGDDRVLAIEVVTGQARARYGPGTIRPATLAERTG